jgi:hypothetical protein
MPIASTLADRLAREARSLEVYVRRTEGLAADGKVPMVDRDRAYVAGYMLFYTSLELAIENLFIGLLTRKLKMTQPGVRPIVTARNQPVAVQLILGDRSYVDWLPFERNTQRRAKALLADGKPFTSMPKPDRRFLERMSVLRNALTHRSTHALRQFEREFIEQNPVPGGLPPAQHDPVGYLRGQHAANQSRLGYQLAEAAAIMRRLCL